MAVLVTTNLSTRDGCALCTRDETKEHLQVKYMFMCM